ncbi:MAG: sialate O-acetylesterase [Tannerellaceae bacterium]|nr:sialate O-acetylesterase [Tannerellaceae bacterium]
MKRILFCLFLLTLFFSIAQAKVKLLEILGDHMVLQQNTRVNIWGEAAPGRPIQITSSWSEEVYTGNAGSDGHWLIPVRTPAASNAPQWIRIDDGEAVILNDILIGEVWFCSGQSNMEMPLRGFWNCPVEGANQTIATSGTYNHIRVATIPKTAEVTPQATISGRWKVSTPEHAAEFTATGYYFAMLLNQALDVPVGLINCSWGGSSVEGWLNKEMLETYPDVDLSLAGSDRIHPMSQPMIMYNGMLHPLTKYTIKGFLWYQGEANVGRHQTYAERLAAMVNLWRSEWQQEDLPFYYVEIAPYEYGEGDAAAYLREAQYKAQQLIPNSGMVCTNDLVEAYERMNIHPKNKRTVGERLAYMALNNTYGYKSILCRGPEYDSMEVQDGQVILSFTYADEGFNREDGILGFEIAGADQTFYPAIAVADLDTKKIVVSSEQVTDPVAVRYGFRNYLPGNLYNIRELPVVPFRTDTW